MPCLGHKFGPDSTKKMGRCSSMIEQPFRKRRMERSNPPTGSTKFCRVPTAS